MNVNNQHGNAVTVQYCFYNGSDIVLITLVVMVIVILEIKEDMCVHPRGLGAAGPKYQMNLVATLYFDRGKGIFQWVCSCTIENGTLCKGRVSTESKQVSTRGRLQGVPKKTEFQKFSDIIYFGPF